MKTPLIAKSSEDISALYRIMVRTRLMGLHCLQEEVRIDGMGAKATQLQVDHSATCNIANKHFVEAASLISQARASLVKAHDELKRGKLNGERFEMF